jgi:hypothetical protein
MARKINELRIMGTKATVTAPMLSPISRITGTCVAHMKFTMMTSAQSMVFCDVFVFVKVVIRS